MDSLLRAVRMGNEPLVRQLVQNGISVHHLEYGLNALYYAVSSTNPTLVSILLEAGASATDVTPDGALPNVALQFAASREAVDSVERLLAVLQLLHNAGAKYDCSDERATTMLLQCGSIRLMQAVFHDMSVTQLVEYLATNGISLDTADGFGFTRLHKAVQHRSLETVHALLNAGARVNIDSFLGAPLHIAVAGGNMDIVIELLKCGANPSQSSRSFGSPPLHHAIACGSKDIVDKLLSAGASIHETNATGYGVLQWAIYSNRQSMFEMLIDRGAECKATGVAPSFSLLHFAAAYGRVWAIDLLIKKYGFSAVEVPVRADGVTPLHTAASWGSKTAIELLVKTYHADLNAPDSTGSLPIHSAAKSGYIDGVRTLVELGCFKNAAMTTPPYSRPIHLAAKWGRHQIVDYLIEQGVDVNFADEAGRTALHYVAEFGYYAPTVSHLFRRDAVMDVRDKEGRTPLHLSVANRRTAVTRELLLHGAITTLTCDTGTPLDMARQMRHAEHIALLNEAGTPVKLA